MDDVLAVSQSPESIIKDIGLSFYIKDNKYGPPTAYLCANVEPFQISDGKYAWIIKYKSYVMAAVKTIKYLLYEDHIELKNGKRPHRWPLSHGYKPDLDVTDKCDTEHVSLFQKLIEILRWALELGRVGTHKEVVLLSQYQSFPQEGYLYAPYLILHFLSNKHKKRLVMDPNVPDVDKYVFNFNADWKEFYGGVVEEDPHQIPDPLVKPVYVG